MVLPVPWCWAHLSHSHLSALPLCLCHLCSKWLPAPPVNPQCIHGRRGRCPGRDSPDAGGEADKRGALEQPAGVSVGVRKRELSGGAQEAPTFLALILATCPLLSQCKSLSRPAGSGSCGLVQAPLCFVLAVPLVLEWQGLAPCFTFDSSPLLVLQSHCCGLFEELWMVLAFETNRFWV